MVDVRSRAAPHCGLVTAYNVRRRPEPRVGRPSAVDRLPRLPPDTERVAMKLATKLLLVFLLAVTAITGLFSYLTIRQARYQFAHQQELLGERIAKEHRQRLADAYRQGGEQRVTQTAERIYVDVRQSHVRWISRPSQTAAPSQGENRSVSDMAQPLPPEVVSETRRTVVLLRRGDDGAGRVHTYLPVPLNKDETGYLEITQPTDQLDAQTRATLRYTLISLLATFGVSILVVMIAGVRMVGRPLEALIRKTQQIAQGRFDDPLPVRGNDELSELARAINRMSEQLARQQQRLQEESASKIVALEQLRHADRLKTVGRLAAGIAHEMGTPLNVISGRAALIASGKLDEAEIKKSAEAIKHEADRIGAIIRQLLDFARQNTPKRAPIPLREAVQQTVGLLRTLAQKHNVSLEFDLPEDPLVVLADEAQMQQVLTNIVVNAIQASPAGGQVRVSLRDAGERLKPGDAQPKPRHWVAIDIQDQGPGIPTDVLDHIFEPFFTTKQIGEGTGLGLSIAYGIVQEHDGWIDVDSRPGHGTRFTIYLPRELSP